LKLKYLSFFPARRDGRYIEYGEKYSECSEPSKHVVLKKRYDKCQKARDAGYTSHKTLFEDGDAFKAIGYLGEEVNA
jgi:hypothetical protein